MSGAAGGAPGAVASEPRRAAAARAALGAVARAVAAPLSSARTWTAAADLVLGAAAALLVAFVVAAAAERGLTAALVASALMLLLAAAVSGASGALDRRLANALLDAGIEAPQPASARPSWRAYAWTLLRLPLALVALLALVLTVFVALLLVLAPFSGGLGDAPLLAQAWCVLAGIALGLLALHGIDAWRWLHVRLARALLGRSGAQRLVALRERAERLAARAELARDLHDSVGHAVTAATLQAAAARRVLARDPQFAADALKAIEQQGRRALDELDHVLASLRDEDDGAARGARAAPRRPAPGLGDVDRLLERTRAAGVPLTVVQRGERDGIAPVLDREAYRVLQEGLTNVLRHAAGATTRVLVEAASDQLAIVVDDDGGRALDPRRRGGGSGLRAAGERVRALGGTLEAGPVDGGGYRLRAMLPLRRR
ncbi:sensor histidine kinase [Conexibacter woesei]|uniref:histidine kinase n=1 Tax=Conexibacter woesei (strain DSM 14684 / CCUG 47730 / CIP 108061 / JCM 11494 / NBRC 100937 / ID131577) TaxID=469383 RepID=D3F624_CONWI|nr:histidine kinase [Conexibacter woesei]ADB48697.1 integral membrane sensor signal transduction histidine kinase [Conexibacter woesei DSM 14684]